jgi:RNA polymerase sigma-B factor
VSLSALDVDGETEDRGVPVDEAGYEEVEARLFVADALETLDDRDRLVLRLRFEDGLSQSEIAARIGISQMHVSRLLRRALHVMRGRLEDTMQENVR